MATFTTRVELHNAKDPDDYETLHSEMEAENFTRTITSDSGETYQLPTAEYNKEGNMTREQVLECAQRAARKTGKKYSILVTDANARIWINLDRV